MSPNPGGFSDWMSGSYLKKKWAPLPVVAILESDPLCKSRRENRQNRRNFFLHFGAFNVHLDHTARAGLLVWY